MSRHAVTDTSDERQIKLVEDQQKSLDRGLEDIMNNERARKWLYDRIDTLCHLESTSHVPGCSDSTAYNEGSRAVGQAIISEIREAHPNQYLKMLEERLFNQP